MNPLREIEKTPAVPPLTPERIELLNTLCFRENAVHIPPVDCILILGTAISFNELAMRLKPLLQKNLSPTILITGGIEKYQDSRPATRSESKRILETIQAFIPETTEVLLEQHSQNTLENVVFGLKLLARTPRSLCFVGKGFHMGRAYLTLKKYLPNTTLYPYSFDPIYPPSTTIPLTKDNWTHYPESAARVWGEFLRIKTYGERGDIHFEEVKDLVKKLNL